MNDSVFVAGHPAPQGSKRHVGRGILVESSKAVKPWRESIRWAASGMTRHGAGEPVAVDLEFVMPRPTSTPKRRTPPAVKRPDLDKLVRAVFDALTSAGTIADDSQATELRARKRLAELDEIPGVHIRVMSANANAELEMVESAQ
ncbi:RusA family crossover junction endodeoxyribonuclease [Actinoalloteichus sp. GBA129-24]|uniref:RusA family crossover junction endodeoxyribonuclease n=1 Tax=Actinoalloteichus sp. GBA129-24 TaxID=1612551 RepID=UPI00095061C9|nr:RusA family crossover junction endodeoxyribonuclease [Actinoalloteichus sp. GBA129-24]APU20919.1 holliday junction resolvase [Actinoalloteichus sp. GBA129-24]APU24168.1 holliday junction resolvase [Actinoalloteichus sp. GBA129-24]